MSLIRQHPLLVYCDTNVFDNLIKRTNGVTDADELQLRAAVSSRRLTVVVSHINIQETLAALHTRPEIIEPQLTLIAGLANWDYFVRFHSAILEDDIRHYAYNGERANTVFENDYTVAKIRAAVRRVIDDPASMEGLEAVVVEDRDQKRAFLETVKKSNAEAAKELDEFRKGLRYPEL
jgi:hypothetical protein